MRQLARLRGSILIQSVVGKKWHGSRKKGEIVKISSKRKTANPGSL